MAVFAIALAGAVASVASGCTQTTTYIYGSGTDAGHAKSDASDGYGASCEAYYGSGGCCVQIANGIQSAVDACNQAKSAIDQGVAAGEPESSFESACKEALESAQSIGECQGDAGSNATGPSGGTGSNGNGAGSDSNGNGSGSGAGSSGSSATAPTCPSAAPTEADLALSIGWKSPAAVQTTACSSTDLDTLLTHFESTSITGYNQLEAGLSASCVSCVFTLDSAPNWSVIVLDHTNTANGFLNFGACYGAKVSASCGQAEQYYDECFTTSCESCDASDYGTCLDSTTTASACEANFAGATQTACGSTSTGSPSIDSICNNAIYAAAALCGGDAPDAG